MVKSDSFYNLETLGGIFLFIAALIAILITNSPLHGAYEHIRNKRRSHNWSS